jgi:endonuclease/exonuclease/phosphatase family metal-dependent hydrolase
LNIHAPSKSVDDRNNAHVLVLWANILLNNGKNYNIANTHFTWTHEGMATPFQIEDAKKLINILDTNLDSFILMGDTNAPRGRATFDLIADNFKDNIPKEYITSIDQNLHRVKGLIYMIDCLFTKGDIEVKDVKLMDGISDHMVVVGEIN